MTTIAIKDGTIAYDSRVTAGDLISDDDHEKCSIVNSVRFFFSGSLCDQERFIQLYFNLETNFKNIGCSAFVVVDRKLFKVAVDDEQGMWRQELKLSIPNAAGSGSQFALTAMDLGCSAKKAVKMAIKRDSKSGGKIRTYKI